MCIALSKGRWLLESRSGTGLRFTVVKNPLCFNIGVEHRRLPPNQSASATAIFRVRAFSPATENPTFSDSSSLIVMGADDDTLAANPSSLFWISTPNHSGSFKSVIEISHRQQLTRSWKQLAIFSDLSCLESPDTGLLQHHRSSTSIALSVFAAIFWQLVYPVILSGIETEKPTSKNCSISGYRAKKASVELRRLSNLSLLPDVDGISLEKIDSHLFTGLTPDEEAILKLPVSQRRIGEPSLPRVACFTTLRVTASPDYYRSFPPSSSAAAEEEKNLGRTLNLLSGLKPMKNYYFAYWIRTLVRFMIFRLFSLLGFEPIKVNLSLYHFPGTEFFCSTAFVSCFLSSFCTSNSY